MTTVLQGTAIAASAVSATSNAERFCTRLGLERRRASNARRLHRQIGPGEYRQQERDEPSADRQIRQRRLPAQLLRKLVHGDHERQAGHGDDPDARGASEFGVPDPRSVGSSARPGRRGAGLHPGGRLLERCSESVDTRQTLR